MTRKKTNQKPDHYNDQQFEYGIRLFFNTQSQSTIRGSHIARGSPNRTQLQQTIIEFIRKSSPNAHIYKNRQSKKIQPNFHIIALSMYLERRCPPFSLSGTTCLAAAFFFRRRKCVLKTPIFVIIETNHEGRKEQTKIY